MWSLDEGFMWASHFRHWAQVSCVEPCFWTSTLSILSLPLRYYLCVLLFAVRYSSNSLSKKCHFGHMGDANLNIIFSLQKTAPMFIGKSWERQTKMSRVNMLTLHELFSDGQFESSSYTLLRKSDFFFCDSIDEDEEVLYDDNYKWLHQIRNQWFFLPTWSGCFLGHICNPCLYTGWWIESWPSFYKAFLRRRLVTMPLT